jgi:hypothetical protein
LLCQHFIELQPLLNQSIRKQKKIRQYRYDLPCHKINQRFLLTALWRQAIEFKLFMRDANQVHQLAKSSFLSISVVSWDDDPPGFIMPYVITDVILLDQK